MNPLVSYPKIRNTSKLREFPFGVGTKKWERVMVDNVIYTEGSQKPFTTDTVLIVGEYMVHLGLSHIAPGTIRIYRLSVQNNGIFAEFVCKTKRVMVIDQIYTYGKTVRDMRGKKYKYHVGVKKVSNLGITTIGGEFVHYNPRIHPNFSPMHGDTYELWHHSGELFKLGYFDREKLHEVMDIYFDLTGCYHIDKPYFNIRRAKYLCDPTTIELSPGVYLQYELHLMRYGYYLDYTLCVYTVGGSPAYFLVHTTLFSRPPTMAGDITILSIA